MRDYELTVLAKGDLEEKELDKEIKALQTLLEKAGAKVKAKKDAQKRPLSYEIGRKREAYYVFMELQLEPKSVAEVENKLRLEDNLVRYLLVES